MTRYNISITTIDGNTDHHKNVQFEIDDTMLSVNNYGTVTCYPICNVKKYVFFEV